MRTPGKPGARPGGDTPGRGLPRRPDGPENPCYAKHVVLRTDRSDGFVGRNFLHARRQGARLLHRGDRRRSCSTRSSSSGTPTTATSRSRPTTTWSSAATDSGRATPSSTRAPRRRPASSATSSFYPDERYNTTIKKCDLHGSAMGYSGSMGNSVRVTQNRFYGNANGLTTDTISAPGHPGFPADGDEGRPQLVLLEQPRRLRARTTPFEALVPQAIGTGNHVAGDERRRRSARTGCSTTGARARCWSRSPTRVAGDGRGQRGRRDPLPGRDRSRGAAGADGVASTSCDNRVLRQPHGRGPGQLPRPTRA